MERGTGRVRLPEKVAQRGLGNAELVTHGGDSDDVVHVVMATHPGRSITPDPPDPARPARPDRAGLRAWEDALVSKQTLQRLDLELGVALVVLAPCVLSPLARPVVQ